MAAAIASAPSARAFYDRQYHFAEDVDRPNPARLWRALRPLEPLAGTTLLDLGCGVGWATRLVADQGAVARAVGLDFSRTALTLAAAQPRPSRASPIDWVCGDGTGLPFANGSFDRAFSFGSMEHFLDVHRGFAEMARVLRPGGAGVSVVPNFYVRTGQPVEYRASLAGWQRIIERAGLTITGIWGDPGPAIGKNRRPVRLALRIGLRAIGAIPWLRYQFIIRVRKR